MNWIFFPLFPNPTELYSHNYLDKWYLDARIEREGARAKVLPCSRCHGCWSPSLHPRAVTVLSDRNDANWLQRLRRTIRPAVRCSFTGNSPRFAPNNAFTVQAHRCGSLCAGLINPAVRFNFYGRTFDLTGGEKFLWCADGARLRQSVVAQQVSAVSSRWRKSVTCVGKSSLLFEKKVSVFRKSRDWTLWLINTF